MKTKTYILRHKLSDVIHVVKVPNRTFIEAWFNINIEPITKQNKKYRDVLIHDPNFNHWEIVSATGTLTSKKSDV